MIKRIILFSLSLFMISVTDCMLLKAQDVVITASAPSVVSIGQAFNYTLSGDFEGNVELPAMKGLRIVGGPSTSVSQQFTNINGKMQMTKQVMYTYTMLAEQEGEFTIPPSKIISDKKEYITNELKIKVIKGTQPAPSAGPQEGNDKQNSKNESIFVQMTPSKKSVYLGEQLIVTSKMFTQEALQIANLKAPTLEGFWKEDLKVDEKAVREVYNGQNYLTLTFSRYLLTAQKPGEIGISPMEVNCLIQKRVKSRNPSGYFDDPFFNDPFFNNIQTVEQTVLSNPLSIIVKPLPPGAPPGFSGAVGSFSLKAIPDKYEAKVNDAISLKLTITGKGNLMLLKPLKVDFPADLEVFDPKSTQNLLHTTEGTNGSVSFDYLIIPRHAGKYRIAPVVFSYFDPSIGKYQTLKTNEFIFTIDKSEDQDESFISAPGTEAGRGRMSVNKGENVVSLANDIQFIKLTPPKLSVIGKSLFGSLIFNLTYILSLAVFIGLIIFRRERIRRNSDLNVVRNRKARKVAEQRLINARRLMKENDDGFYEEILRALWGYLSDKLGINISDLSREVINQKLHNKVPDNLLINLWKVIDDCEYARYGTGFTGDKNAVYDSAVIVISELQENIK